MGQLYSNLNGVVQFRDFSVGEGVNVETTPSGFVISVVQDASRRGPGPAPQRGAFTPRMDNGSTSFKMTQASVGTWHREGNTVYWSACVAWSGKNGALGGQVRIGGLPFAAWRQPGYRGIVSTGIHSGIAYTSHLVGQMREGESAVTLYDARRVGAHPVALSEASFANEGSIEISGSYIVD